MELYTYKLPVEVVDETFLQKEGGIPHEGYPLRVWS